jgi:hypothetical protein
MRTDETDRQRQRQRTDRPGEPRRREIGKWFREYLSRVDCSVRSECLEPALHDHLKESLLRSADCDRRIGWHSDPPEEPHRRVFKSSKDSEEFPFEDLRLNVDHRHLWIIGVDPNGASEAIDAATVLRGELFDAARGAIVEIHPRAPTNQERAIGPRRWRRETEEFLTI